MLNQMKTIILLGALTALMVAIGARFGQQGLYLALLIALVMNVGSYYFSDKIVLKLYGAKELLPEEAPYIYEMVERLSYRADIPAPRIYRIPRSEPNAFATGRNPANGAVALTDGIMSLLNKRELEGVIAHEIAHIKNRDILIQTVAATIAAAIGIVASIIRWGAIFGGFGGRDGERDGGAIGLIAAAIIAPIAATILQLAVSRSREYHADETAAKLTQNPEGLASALQKLTAGVASARQVSEAATPAYSGLFIVNPLSGGKAMGFVASLFSTHPPIEKRIDRLRSIVID